MRGSAHIGRFRRHLSAPTACTRMTDPATHGSSRDRFKRTLIQVLVVQVVALGVLGLLQILYS